MDCKDSKRMIAFNVVLAMKQDDIHAYFWIAKSNQNLLLRVLIPRETVILPYQSRIPSPSPATQHLASTSRDGPVATQIEVSTYLSLFGGPKPSKTRGCKISPSNSESFCNGSSRASLATFSSSSWIWPRPVQLAMVSSIMLEVSRLSSLSESEWS